MLVLFVSSPVGKSNRLLLGEQTLTQHQSALHRVNACPLIFVLPQFLSLSPITFFASSIKGVHFLWHCRVFSYFRGTMGY